MAEPHLHSVDSAEVVTPQPPSEPPATQRPKRAASKPRPRYAVPTDRMKFDTQVQALRTICTASRNGQDPVTGEMMGNLMGILPVTAVLNNTFFASIGLVDKAGKGAYVPTALTLKFQQKWSFNRAEAPKLLAPALAGSWFFNAVKQKLELGPTTTGDMIETLAGVAGTDDSYATQYGFLLEWLEYVGLIATEGGTVKLTDPAVTPVTTVSPAEEPQGLKDVGTEPEQVPPAGEKPTMDSQRPKDAAQPIISISVEIVLTKADLNGLTREQIAALFEGLGKVAAVKEALKEA